MKKLTKSEIKWLLKKELPNFSFKYSNEDYALAYEDQEYRDAVRNFNNVLPALKWHLKTGATDTLNKFGISIKSVLRVKSQLHTIQKNLSKLEDVKNENILA